MSKILSLFLTLSFVLFSTTSVMADGDTASPTPSPMTKKVTKTVCTTTYGGGTECRDEVVEENITREFDVTEVDTGIAEIAIIASALFFGGLGLFFVAQNQLKA